jgi:hypothetical protein
MPTFYGSGSRRTLLALLPGLRFDIGSPVASTDAITSHPAPPRSCRRYRFASGFASLLPSRRPRLRLALAVAIALALSFRPRQSIPPGPYRRPPTLGGSLCIVANVRAHPPAWAGAPIIFFGRPIFSQTTVSMAENPGVLLCFIGLCDPASSGRMRPGNHRRLATENAPVQKTHLMGVILAHGPRHVNTFLQLVLLTCDNVSM